MTVLVRAGSSLPDQPTNQNGRVKSHNSIEVPSRENMVMGTKNDCANKGQQQFTQNLKPKPEWKPLKGSH
jgi:hypothetical protein